MKRFLVTLLALLITSNAFAISQNVTTYERHLQLPITSAQIVGTAECSERNTVWTGKKVDANTDLFYLQTEIPDDWVSGTNMYFELDWYPAADMSDTETVILKMSYAVVNEDADLDASTVRTATDVTYTSSGATSTGIVKHSRFTITAAHITAQNHIFIKLYRDATADTYNNAAGICATAFELIYTSNAVPQI